MLAGLTSQTAVARSDPPAADKAKQQPFRIGRYEVVPNTFVNDLDFVGFSYDGRRLFTLDRTRGIRAWDAVTGRLLTVTRVKRFPLEMNDVRSSQWSLSPDNHLSVVTSTGGLRLRVLDLDTGDIVSDARLPGSAVVGVSVSPDGRLVAIPDDRARVIRVVTAEGGRVVHTLRPDRKFARRLDGWSETQFSRDGRRLMALGNGPSHDYVMAFDLINGRPL